MANTSVHMSDELLGKLDALADKRGTSRNRLIAEACEHLLERDLGEWPADFFSNDHLSEEERVDSWGSSKDDVRDEEE